MPVLNELLAGNRRWAESLKESDPGFFERLSEIQNPELLWIGCSDSRITPSSSVGLLPGEMFVHRNVANLVNHTDMNCLSVLQYAVEVLKVKHVIVCGHYGCSGVKAAFDDSRFGLIDNWLRHIQDIMHKHVAELAAEPDYQSKLDRLCEISVIEQVVSVGETTIVQDAWDRGQEVAVHGWIYTIADGIYRDLNVSVDNLPDLDAMRIRTFDRLTAGKGK
ncbi:MAG: carbonate dehydratase [Blastocatellia bacterium]|nr:carbonate dehydratase [Chloracidobacterium sp.]MBL8184632.1 carbonate dehydratase [Blastocatellia bacterium]HBE82339.1 carbonate dehydratase [Blastocatellia bacterium]HRJ87277.1 carbonate dehydratase [Pyrinomonadaceae bacterium]HRK50897.1 carbonate dehydratase [Pyrinomonadaceae bacterium]